MDKIRSKESNKTLKTDQMGESVATNIEDYSNQMKEDNMGVNALFEQLNECQ